MRLADLSGRKVAIWGHRLEGASALEHLPRWGVEHIRVVDDDPAVVDASGGVAEPSSAGAFEWADVVVRSAGIPPALTAPIARHTPVVGLVSLWLAQYADAHTIGVTGTKGKSTTASLIADLLRAANVDVALAGNIGTSILDVDPSTPGRVSVLEVSSYQASDVTASPRVGVITSLFEEHLDWHGGWEHYRADKLNLITHGCRSVWTSRQAAPHVDGALADLAQPPEVHRVHGDARPGLGPHPDAIALAVAVARSITELDDATVDAVLADRTVLPHRQHLVATVGGIDFIDDTLATIPAATLDLVDRLDGRPVTLLIGGHDRGIDHIELSTGLRDRPNARIVAMPDTGPVVAAELAAEQVLGRADELGEAVQMAIDAARPGETIALSPAAPSYHRWKNHAQLSAAFAALVQES